MCFLSKPKTHQTKSKDPNSFFDKAGNKTLKIYVRALSSKNITLEVQSSDTINFLKAMIQNIENMPFA